MKKLHSLAFVAIAVSAAVTLAGCAGSSTTSSSSTKEKSVTIWMMDGDLSTKTLADVSKRFKAETGIEPKVEIQQWDNINTKLTTALSQSNPPDVVDIGNTDVPLFADNGALKDLTSDKAALDRGQTWLSGLSGPATLSGKLYAAPLFAGNRAIIYNKKIWAAAGITTTPKTWTELTSDLDKIKAANPSPTFSAMYLPGEDWQSNLSFLFDAGAQIATQKGGKWTAKLDSSAAQKGFTEWKTFQNDYSTASSRNATAYVPDPNAIFGAGNAASISNVNLEPSVLIAKYPSLKGEIGTFPWPSENHPGKLMPVFLGGSDVAIPARSVNQTLALKYISLLTSPAVQKADVVGIDGWTPISTQLVDQTIKTLAPVQRPFFTAAKNSVPTPSTPGWATVESDLMMENLFGQVTTGSQSVQAATTASSKKITTALNGN